MVVKIRDDLNNFTKERYKSCNDSLYALRGLIIKRKSIAPRDWMH